MRGTGKATQSILVALAATCALTLGTSGIAAAHDTANHAVADTGQVVQQTDFLAPGATHTAVVGEAGFRTVNDNSENESI